MKINNIGPASLNPYNRNTNNMNKENDKANKATDKIEISDAAKEMQQVSQYTLDRQAKVNELKLQVENGTYKMNPGAVANSVYNYFFEK